jgi:hypothetical protein
MKLHSNERDAHPSISQYKLEMVVEEFMNIKKGKGQNINRCDIEFIKSVD